MTAMRSRRFRPTLDFLPTRIALSDVSGVVGTPMDPTLVGWGVDPTVEVTPMDPCLVGWDSTQTAADPSAADMGDTLLTSAPTTTTTDMTAPVATQ
jgi:hypothetical protein